MISHKYKFIFIHIPKCAGTTIEKRLADNKTIFDWNYEAQVGEGNPLPFGNLRGNALAKTIERFSAYYLFAFCRNPWHRLVSTYLHSKRGEGEGYFKRMTPLGSFASFVKEARMYLIEQNPGPLSGFEKHHLLPQIQFIPKASEDFFGVTMKPDLTINHVGRVEFFDLDFSTICEHLGIGVSTNKKYMTSSYPQPWEDYYDDSLIDMVNEIYKEDVSYFNYARPQ